jgi:glucose/arabinose dehydrogenase
MIGAAVATFLVLAPALALAAVCPAPFSVGGDPRVQASDFRITRFATGLDFPFGMVSLDDGSLLVGTSVPNFAGGGLFASTWRLRRLVDADGDGCADGAGSILFNGFAGPVTGVRRADGLVFVAAAQRIFVLRLGALPTDSLTLVGSLDLTFAANWSHPTQSLAVRGVPGQARVYQLLFNVGSRANFSATATTVPLSGLFTATLDADSLYLATVDDAGPALVVTGVTRLASGLRNAFGIAFQPGTGDLYFEDNGIDGLVDPSEPLSADELNRISSAAVGGAVESFGFPSHYVTYRTGTVVGSGGILPLVAFQPVPPPNGAESEGPAEIAFAPPGFPVGLSDGLFVGFNGRFSAAGTANEENALVYVDLDSNQHFHFVAPQHPSIGHLDSLLVTESSLFAADLSNVGGLTTSGSGSIYQFQSLVSVPALYGWGVAFLALCVLTAGGTALCPPARRRSSAPASR